MNETIPKTTIGFYFSNDFVLKSNGLKPNNLIRLISFNGFYVIETAYNYYKTKDKQKAEEIYKDWCESEEKIRKEMVQNEYM